MADRDRLYISSHNRVLLEQIDDRLKASKANLERKEIFFIAMALGLDNPTEIKGKKEGLFLLKNLRDKEMNLLNVCAWHHYRSIDKLEDVNEVLTIAEHCANTGFKILEQEIRDNRDAFLTALMADTKQRFSDL